MIQFFSAKASRISLAINRSWHIVYFFSLITYLAAYIFLHFQETTDTVSAFLFSLMPLGMQFIL
ncbi:MAG: hypothetical protein IH618_14395 [Ignavibacteriaceae bacterium]|nr:hypothetical protein [Ignavibacteriaceae bacterium]